jgi:hypothetical protein
MHTNPKAVIAAAVLMLTGMLYPSQPCHAIDEYDAIEIVTIDVLADLYKPVVFNHQWHTKLAPCKDCHHHTTGRQDMDPNCIRCHANSKEATSVACSSCHSSKQFYPEQLNDTRNPTLYHIDKPGLKGAYHLNCVPCHVKTNAPSHCEGCHALTDAGKQYFQVNKQAAPGKSKGSHAQ